MVCLFARRIVWTLALIFSSLSLAIGQAQLRVNEAAAQLHIELKPSGHDLTLKLPIENLSSRTLDTHIVVELLKPDGKVRARAEQEATIPSRSTTVKIPLPWEYAHGESDAMQWDRVRYSVTPSDAATAKSAKGIMAVSAINPELVRLQVVGPGYARAGEHANLRVRAQQVASQKPVAGVNVQAFLDVNEESDTPLLTPKAVTDRDGFATLSFTLPLDVSDDEIDVTVTGSVGKLSVTADGEVKIWHSGTWWINTDKQLYQPGQTVHMRLLAFGDDHKALAEKDVNIEVEDPEQHIQFATSLRTSRFGVAATGWQIPESLRLGTYLIKAKFDDDQYKNITSSATVQVSRYELPTFAVSAKADKNYYLPGHNAAVDVHADYLFGKPVLHGRVRVVREDSREWNYRNQKWDIKEGAVYEGDADEQGHYVAHLDLTQDHVEMAKDNYNRFLDLHLAAYFTDASTRRTEQRRFDIRLTREPIHVYLIGDRALGATGMPLNFVISTHYADGLPAPCDVQIGWLTEPQKKAAGRRPSPAIPLRKVHTNRYGLAKVSGLKGRPVVADEDTYLTLAAADRHGAVGHHAKEINLRDETAISVATDKIIYRPGDPIEVTLSANRPDLMVFVEASRDDQVVASQGVYMHGGRADIEFPPNNKYQNDVTILATVMAREFDEYSNGPETYGYHTVLFPKNRELQVAVRPGQSTYRPGDEATVDLRVSGPQGEKLQSALGVAVVDKALEERERPESEFGTARGSNSWRSDDDGYDGFRKKDLDKLDPEQPLPEGMELVAEVLLQRWRPEPNEFESYTDNSGLREMVAAEIEPQIKRLSAALDQYHLRTHNYPETFPALKTLLAVAGIKVEDLRDPWGEPYKFDFGPEQEWMRLVLNSPGPDKKFGTPDDLHETGLTWRYFDRRKESIATAETSLHSRTSGYIRNIDTLRSELARQGANVDSWKDAWNHAYQYEFGAATTQYTVTVMSAGPDGHFSSAAIPSNDDFAVAVIGFDYASDLQQQIGKGLNTVKYGEKRPPFPQNIDELQKALESTGIPWDSVKDPWGRPYYATFPEISGYGDDITIKNPEGQGQPPQPRTEVTPVTKHYKWIYVRSAGPDGITGTADDFTVATFSQARYETSAYAAMAVLPIDQSIFIGSAGAISGTVQDPNRGNSCRRWKSRRRTLIPRRSAQQNRDRMGNMFSATYEPDLICLPSTTQDSRSSI